MLKKVLAPLALLAITAVALPAQDLDEVLSCYYETIGGLDAWKDLQSMEMHGRMTLGPGMEAPITMLNARPGKFRMDFTFQGMTGTQAYDGETGWQVMPFMGSSEPTEMTEDEMRDVEENGDVDGPFIGYEEQGLELELLGTDEVDGTEAYRIRVTHQNGNQETYFLDTEYCLPFRVEASREVQGQTIQIITTIGDYKDVGGLVMAHSMETSIPGMPTPRVMTIDSVTLNPDIDPSVFAMPESGGN